MVKAVGIVRPMNELTVSFKSGIKGMYKRNISFVNNRVGQNHFVCVEDSDFRYVWIEIKYKLAGSD